MKVLSFLGAVGVGIFTAAWLASLQRKGQTPGVDRAGRSLEYQRAV